MFACFVNRVGNAVGNAAVLVACTSAIVLGCGSKEEEAKGPPEPIVGIMELPVTMRTTDAAPTDFRKIEISQTELRVDGENVLTLAGGRIAVAERTGDIVPKLKDKLSTPARSAITIELHAGTPYGTLALVLASASTAGIRNVAFKVRKVGGSPDTGWLALTGFHTVSAGSDATFENVATRPWSDFATAWEAVEGGCRSASTGNCAYKADKIAEGGQLLIVLHSSGDGININFKQIGAPTVDAGTAPAKPKVAMLEGVPVDPVRELEETPPATSASFQFRSKEAQSSPSAITATIKPICGTAVCGALVQADAITLITKVLALTGAAFPDGTPAPSLAFEVPN